MNSRMQGFERGTLMAVWSSKGLWLMHVLGNALLMVAFFYWTRIPEESGRQFALTLVCGLLIALATLWLHSATFDYFRPAAKPSLKQSFRSSAVRIPAFFLWMVIFGLGFWLIGQLWRYDEQVGGWIRHLLPGLLRRAVTSRFMFSAASWFVWFLYFFLWPLLLLPVGAQVAIKSFCGFFSAAAFRLLREPRYWIAYLICFLVGAYVPYKLAWMTPTRPSTLDVEKWSMVLRLGFGYLLMVTAWLVLSSAMVRTDGSDAGEALMGEPEREPIGAAPVT